VIAWETLRVGHLLYAHQTEMNWSSSFRMRMSYVCSVKSKPRLELARYFLVGVP